MRSTAIVLGLSVLAQLVGPSPTRGDGTVVNTPVVSGLLRGDWELQSTDAGAFKQRLHLGGSVEGSWRQSRESLPMTIAWFVEGSELRIFHYHDPRGAFNYRVKDLTFSYRIDGDRLVLTRGGVEQSWKRVREVASKP